MAFTQKPQPLWSWLQEYREDGVDVAAFKTTSGPNAGKRFALRIVDPDNPEDGLTHVASFANSLRIADRDPENPQEQTRQNIALNEILNDSKKAAKYMVCFCIVDEESVKAGKATKEHLGDTFTVITTPQVSKSDAFRTYSEAAAESKTSGVKSDAKPKRASKK